MIIEEKRLKRKLEKDLKRIRKEKRPNLLIEGVKSFLGKYCKKIEWEK